MEQRNTGTPHLSWVVVVPVKGSAAAKSRLGNRADLPNRVELAEAFALDTVSVLLAATAVGQVFVVTADAALAARVGSLGAQIVLESSVAGQTQGDPLNSAIHQGIAAARTAFPAAPVAVFTGDLPALTVTDVATTLALAAAHDRSMVADEEGTGTTALLVRAGISMISRFGLGSRAAHEAAGHVPLDLAPTAAIRRDVDTVANLTEALRLGLGPYSSALIASASAAMAAVEASSLIHNGTAFERMPADSSTATAAESDSSTSHASSTPAS